ncbi:uncharacterized protein LOC136088429 [Hydra vulgaris]|uniref:Uncharacterized protein LOC136088429 n=1 Tax=Hydra vulgaris TaxID=6087 RepID=A0ABM4D1S5_HYDVU
MTTNNENYENMFPDFGDVFEEEQVESVSFNDIFAENMNDYQQIKMSANIYPCCFCDEEFTKEQLMEHQIEFSHECFTCKKKVQDLLNHKCDYEFLNVIQKIFFFCNTAVDNRDYYEHSVICFQYYKEQQNKYFEQIIQHEKKNLNYLNLSINHIMGGMKNHQEILAKQINSSKQILNKQKEEEREIKKLKQENTKLHQTLEEMNKEMSELKNLVYDNMLVLANQEEMTKLNQIVEENSTEFLELEKITQHSKEIEMNPSDTFREMANEFNRDNVRQIRFILKTPRGVKEKLKEPIDIMEHDRR